MSFMHALTELLCKPCLIDAAMHKQLCDIVRDHISGEAHGPNGRATTWVGLPANAFDIETPKPPDAPMPSKFTRMDNIARIDVDGVIGKRVSGLERMSGAADVDFIGAAVQEASDDETIEGILLNVNSPGGGITGVPELGELIASTDRLKPVVAFTDQTMASAAYWISAGASMIVASQSASVGSVGVYMAFLDTSRAFELAGLRTELIKQGKFKGMGIQGTSLTDDQRALLQESVDTVATWFKGFITANRVVGQGSMEGQSFYAAEAVTVGLADMVGNEGDAVAALSRMIELRKSNNTPNRA
jgi:protease-4